jgi:hypothetical protein
MLGNRGYYSPNAKVFEGYKGIISVKTYLLSILLVESALVQKLIVANSYALDNNANIDDVGNYIQGVNQIEDFSSIPDNQSGEDVVPF